MGSSPVSRRAFLDLHLHDMRTTLAARVLKSVPLAALAALLLVGIVQTFASETAEASSGASATALDEDQSAPMGCCTTEDPCPDPDCCPSPVAAEAN